jgi:hypothetical protein
MSELSDFVKRIIEINPGAEELSLDQARSIVKEINDFLYTNTENIGTVDFGGKEFDFFSEFHKYWLAHNKEILDIQINEDNCKAVAIKLHEVYVRTKGIAFKEIYDTCGLSKKDVCRVRFLTANQDFNGSRDFSKLAECFKIDKSIFDEKIIAQNPEDFLKEIKVTRLSQNDKRIKYAKQVSEFLIKQDCIPFDLIKKFDMDVALFKDALINQNGAGYGNKKADMFIRDMVVNNIWTNVINFDKINVASDINTIKVALRTGIIKSAIPFVSSFLDIFGYQYAYVDDMNAMAWRKVWEYWQQMYPEDKIISPCMIDYFVYNVIGRQFCREILNIYMCEAVGHIFKYHTGRNKTCQICYKESGIRNKAHVIKKVMPCIDVDGSIAIKETDFYIGNIAKPNYEECPFKEICEKNHSQTLQPPRSISVFGKTGWESAYTRKDTGGGGLMA